MEFKLELVDPRYTDDDADGLLLVATPSPPRLSPRFWAAGFAGALLVVVVIRATSSAIVNPTRSTPPISASGEHVTRYFADGANDQINTVGHLYPGDPRGLNYSVSPQPLPITLPLVSPQPLPITLPLVSPQPLPITLPPVGAFVQKPSLPPIFMMHGIMAAAVNWADVNRMILRIHPGTVLVNIPLYENSSSLTNLQSQVEHVAEYIRNKVAGDPMTFGKGYYFMGFSQGALILRCVAEAMDDHKALRLISLAGPQMGVYGKPAHWLSKHFYLPKDDTTELLYNPELQTTLSIADMWHDPFKQSDFLKDNMFIPRYNGLTNDAVGNSRRKQNFLRLQRAVFLGGVFTNRASDSIDYGGVEPSRSEIWEYFKPGSASEYVPMKQQAVYVSDTFGLRTLDESGRLVVLGVPEIDHQSWVHDDATIEKYVLPTLA